MSWAHVFFAIIGACVGAFLFAWLQTEPIFSARTKIITWIVYAIIFGPFLVSVWIQALLA